MQEQWSTRIGWAELPDHVRSGIEEVLGSRVEEASGQHGGFSPGAAERVRTASGSRAFVKAANSGLNETTPSMYRKEAAVAAALPDSLPAPSFLGSYDDGDWIALVMSDIEGRHPRIPWRGEELTQVLDALQAVAATPVPEELSGLPRLEAEVAHGLAGWARIRSDPPPGSDPWIRANLQRLETLAREGLPVLSGDSLVHNDVRADNILLTDDGALLVDWPWACLGAGWIDGLSILVNVRVFDPTADVDSVLDSHPVFGDATTAGIDGFLSVLGGYFLDAARRPAPQGLPTLRAFQQRQGDAVTAWLRQRLG